MKEIINFLSKVSLAVLAIFGFAASANAQCAAGEVEVSITIDTDQWGYEIYWELVPAGDSCGSANAIATGGNTAVGCNPVGNNGSTASAADPGAYGNSTQIVEGPFCLTEGQDYTLWIYDDWGDGGCSFSSASQGFSYLASGADESFTFTASSASDYDVAIGVSAADPNGWTLDYGRVTGYPYMPVSQLATTEAFMGVRAENRGLNAATNVNVTFNIDLENAGTFTNVYTNTLAIGTLDVDSSAWVYSTISDDSWYQEGLFRYQYIVTQDSVDGKPNSDTITDFFTLTDNVWSKVQLAQDGGPFGDNIYLPGAGTADFVSKMEWGTVYYMPNGDSLGIDNVSLRVYGLSSAAATEAIYYLKIYKLDDADASGTIDFETEKVLTAVVADTVTLTPGTAVSISAQASNFIDFNTGNEFMFENDELYYISIDQVNQVSPGLNDGTTRDGVAVWGQSLNHDGFVYSDSIIGYPFYNPLFIQTTTAGTPTDNAYSYGWTGGPEPSMIINLKDFSTTTTQVTEVEEVAGVVVAPNPTKDVFNVSLDLDNAQEVKFIITDVAGRVAHMSFANNVNQETRTFDIANYPAGVYFFTVVADGARTTKRIVKK